MPSRDAAFSRSGRSDPAGKLLSRLDTPLSEQTASDFRAVAALRGVAVSELNRELIEDFLYGRLRAIRMAAGVGGDYGNKVG